MSKWLSMSNVSSVSIVKYMKVLMKAGKVSGKKAKKVSGYNVFSMESRVGMDGAPGEIMSKLGGMWKKLSEVKKKAFNIKAEKLNKKALAEFEEPETDVEFEKLKCMIEATIKEYKKQVNTTEKVLEKCTVAELKVMCKNKKLATTGTKTLLLERLQEVEVEEEVDEEDEEDEEVDEEDEEDEDEVRDDNRWMKHRCKNCPKIFSTRKNLQDHAEGLCCSNYCDGCESHWECVEDGEEYPLFKNVSDDAECEDLSNTSYDTRNWK
jgi:hypothetical protein